jgi:hypothetical protein
VTPGAEDRYRYDLTWLPDADRIIASAVEHHGGVKVVYDDGHRLEFGIADVRTFSGWAGSPAHVLVGDDAVREATGTVTRARPSGAPDPQRERTLFLTQLASGIGRAHRGEVLSASGLIRGEAVEHLLRAATAAVDDPRLDALDPRRRVEYVLPGLAHELELACRLDPLGAAAALLAIAEHHLGTDRALETVRALVRPARGDESSVRELGNDDSSPLEEGASGLESQTPGEPEQRHPGDPVEPRPHPGPGQDAAPA